MNLTHTERQQIAVNVAAQRGVKQCKDRTVMAALETSTGNVYFGFNFTQSQPVWCPRENMPRGHGYALCKSVCGQWVHAEIDAIQQYEQHEPHGTSGRLFVYGVNHICDGCMTEINKRPFLSVVLVKD